MKRSSRSAICLAVALAFAGIAAANASAAAPEYGRCVAKAGGKYENAGCTKESATAKKFEWEPGPGPKPKFHSTLVAGTVLILEAETPNHTFLKTTCHTAVNVGEVTGPKTTVIKFVFGGCESEAGVCTTPGEASGTITTPLLPDRLIVIKKELEATKNKIGDDIGTSGTGFTEFNCGGAPVVVKGSVIRAIRTNSMLSKETAKFVQAHARQKPEKGEGEFKDVLEASIAGSSFGFAGLALSEVQESEEKLEVNTVA